MGLRRDALPKSVVQLLVAELGLSALWARTYLHPFLGPALLQAYPLSDLHLLCSILPPLCSTSHHPHGAKQGTYASQPGALDCTPRKLHGCSQSCYFCFRFKICSVVTVWIVKVIFTPPYPPSACIRRLQIGIDDRLHVESQGNRFNCGLPNAHVKH